MTATSRPPRRPRIRTGGPPPAPTPIRTARGARSAAADDLVLAEFLESTIRVPNLTLPPLKRFQFPPPPPPELPCVAAQALLSGESSAAAVLMSAAAGSGAFSVAGAVDASEVREAVRAASEALFEAPEEVKRRLRRWFGSRDDHATMDVEEFSWFLRPVCTDDDRALETALPGATDRVFRAKMSSVASKMEDVATSVIRVLSDSAKKDANGSPPSGDTPSILRLTLCSCKLWSHSCRRNPPSSSHALSIHLSGNDQQICIRNHSGSAVFSLPAGSMLITVGKQIQDWSDGEFKSAAAEMLFEKTDEHDGFITLELLHPPGDHRQHLSEFDDRHDRCIDRPKTVAFGDQILVALLLLSVFYLFWN